MSWFTNWPSLLILSWDTCPVSPWMVKSLTNVHQPASLSWSPSLAISWKVTHNLFMSISTPWSREVVFQDERLSQAPPTFAGDLWQVSVSPLSSSNETLPLANSQSSDYIDLSKKAMCSLGTCISIQRSFLSSCWNEGYWSKDRDHWVTKWGWWRMAATYITKHL